MTKQIDFIQYILKDTKGKYIDYKYDKHFDGELRFNYFLWNMCLNESLSNNVILSICNDYNIDINYYTQRVFDDVYPMYFNRPYHTFKIIKSMYKIFGAKLNLNCIIDKAIDCKLHQFVMYFIKNKCQIKSKCIKLIMIMMMIIKLM